MLNNRGNPWDCVFMQISDLILNKNIDEADGRNKELNVYRIILLLCSTFTLLLRYLFIKEEPNVFDPLVIRVVFSFMLLIIFVLTYFKEYEERIVYLNYMVFCFYSFHALVLIHRNNFSINYIIEFIILVMIICLAFRERIHIYIYIGIIFFSFVISCLMHESNFTDRFVNISLVGIFCGAILIFFDSRIEIEDELRVREDLLNTVFNESPDSIFLADPSSSMIINCNDRAQNTFEATDMQDLIGNNLNYLLKFPYSPGAWNNFKKKFEKNKFLIQELEFKTFSSKVFWGSQAITEIKVGSGYLWLVRITDITERVKDKKTIEENRKMLRQVIDLVPNLIFLKDNSGRFVVANQAVADRYNTTPEMLIGKTDGDFYDEPHIAKKIMSDDMEVIKTGKEKFLPEEYFRDKNGNILILQMTRIPFYIEEDRKPGVLGIAIDITERVKDKLTLDENRKMLRQIIDLVPHQIYLKDRSGHFLVVNQAMAEFHNKSIDDLIGLSDSDIFKSEEANVIRKVEEDVIAKGRTRFIPEEALTDFEQHQRIFNSIKMPFFLNDKKEVGLLGINIDITEAKSAEKAIKESEARYRILMEQASDGIYLSDQEGNIIDANPKACEMFGYSMKEFMALNIKKLVDPVSFKDSVVRVPDLKDKQSIILERKFLKKDGTPFTVEVSAKLLEDGRHQAIIRDITERKRMENILKDNERKFSALIQNSYDIITILSEEFKIKFISDSANRILGYKTNELLEKSIFELIHPDEMDMVSVFLSNTLVNSGKNFTSEELKIRTKKGDMLYSEVVAVNMLDDVVISGIIINFHDITKRKYTEMELLNTNFELDSFVYKASHDLKAPLRSVMGLIKLARLESKDANQNMYLEMMNKSVISLDSFIKDLTQFSRNSRMEIEAKLIDFDKIVEEALGNLKFMDHAEGIIINKKFKFEADFYTDITRISTIINNLLSNAIKYHRFENNNPFINIIIETNKEQALFIVEDNGAGIDSIHVDKVFEMFYRASESSYGSGLGLYIVKNAVSKLHGTIQLKSVLNEGTKFIVEIPNLLKDNEK